ncbi:MAG: Na/Pi cotransporter family protein [Bacillota bacterium]|jgi:phosphate:Na+ symporter
MVLESLFGLFAGLAILIFSIQNMGTGLQKAAGNKMRRLLEVLTGVPVLGVLVGTAVTAVVQSSSLTTVMVVGFVNAGLLTLRQAISVIMGANIGTTVTAQIIAFNVSYFSLPVLAVGFFLYFFAQNKNRKNIGQIIFSLGFLLFGISFMSNSMGPLGQTEFFQNIILTLGQYPIIGLLMGFFLTSIIQSSSASIGLLIALGSQGLITLDIALPVLLGDNIGTCVTSLLASIGAKLNGKRSAMAHLLFNIIGSIIFLAAMPFYKEIVVVLSPTGDIARQIANAHTILNIVNTIIMLPLINIFVKILIKIFPGEERIIPRGPIFLNRRQTESPQLSITLTTNELIHMGELVAENMQNACQAFVKRDQRLVQEVFEIEHIVNNLDREITSYLAKVAQNEMSEALSLAHTGLLYAVNDIEKVSNHAQNIAKMAETSREDNLKYSQVAMEEVLGIHDIAYNTFLEALEALRTNNISLAKKILAKENEIKKLEKQLRKSHIMRLNQGQCQVASAVVFLDIISNYERIGDHANNIAHVVIRDI